MTVKALESSGYRVRRRYRSPDFELVQMRILTQPMATLQDVVEYLQSCVA